MKTVTCFFILLGLLVFPIYTESATIYSNNFELDNGGLITNGTHLTWEWGKQYTAGPSSANSGTNCWGTKLNNYYGANNITDYLTLTNLDFTGKSYGNISFYLYSYCEYNDDGCDLQISTNGGTNYFTIGDYSSGFYNYSSVGAFSGSNAWSGYFYWEIKEIDISKYVNNNKMNMRFRFKSDSSAYYYYGIYLDDLVVHDTPFPVAGTGWAYIDPTFAFPGETNSVIKIRYQSEKNMIEGSKVAIDIPTGWTPPQDTSSNSLGFVEVVPYSGSPVINTDPTIVGNQIIVYITNMNKYDQIEIRYGKGVGVVAPSTPGEYTFKVKSANPVETLTEISSSPKIKLFQKMPSPYTEDFEGTADGWYQEGGSYGQWELGAPINVGPSSAHSSSKCYGVNIDGNYIRSWASEFLYSPPIDLKNVTNAYLSFYQWFDIYQNKNWMNDDGGAVYISTNNMGWYKIGYYPFDYNNNGDTSWWWDMAPWNNGKSGGWQNMRVDLKDYVGKVVFFRFVFSSGGHADSSYPGWYIDDFAIYTNKMPVAGSGACAVSRDTAPVSFPVDLTFTYTAGANINNGQVQLEIPSGWSAPQNSSTATPGYVRIVTTNTQAKVNPTPTILGNYITVDITNMAILSSFNIVYSNALTPATVGLNKFTVMSKGQGESFSEIKNSPEIVILPKISSFPYNEDFETDNGEYQTPATLDKIWEWGIPNKVRPYNAYSGLRCWGTKITNYYDVPGTGRVSHLYSSYIDLTSEPKAYLELAYYIDTEKWKQVGGFIGISTNDSPYYQLGSYPDIYNNQCFYWDPEVGVCFSGWEGTAAGWRNIALDLTPYAGKLVRLRFTFTDGWTMESGHSGLYIDKIKIIDEYIPIAGTGKAYIIPDRVLPSSVNNYQIIYKSEYNFYGGTVSFEIPAGFTAPQTSVPINPGYVTVSVLSNAIISSNLQITGTGPWTVTVNVSNIIQNGAIFLTYNSATTPAIIGAKSFVTKSALSTETPTEISRNPVVYVMKTINSFPYVEDFEIDDGYFMPAGNLDALWEWGTPSVYPPTNAYSGSKCWGTDLDGTYPIKQMGSLFYHLYSPIIDLSGTTNWYLEFSFYNDTENWRAGSVVMISTNGGTNFVQLGSYPYDYQYQGVVLDTNLGTWLDVNYGDLQEWRTLKFDLTKYSNKKIQLDFRFYENWPLETGHSGLYIDKVVVDKGYPPIAGSGNGDVSPAATGPSSLQHYTFTYTSENDFYNGYVTIEVPSDWSVPQTADTNLNGFVKISYLSNGVVNSNLQITGTGPWTIQVTVTNIMKGGGFDLDYWNAVSPVDTGVSTFTMKSALISETLTSLENSPTIYVLKERVPPFTEDFESDNGGFAVLDSTHYKWEWGAPAWGPSSAYSGGKCWGTDLDDNYSDSYISDNLFTHIIDLTTLTQASVVFYHWYDMANWDAGGLVSISTDFENFTTLGSYPNDYNNSWSFGWDWPSEYNGKPCYSGSSGGWVKEAFNLTPYCGNKVILRFHFGSSAVNTEHPGWYIDKMQFLDTPPPVAGTGDCSVTPSASIAGSTSVDYTFTFTAKEDMYSGSKVKIYFPDIWPAPVPLNNNVDISSTVSFDTNFDSETGYNYIEITLLGTLSSGNTITVKYTNVDTPSSTGSYTFITKTAGASETLTEISSSPQIILQEIQTLPYTEDFENDNGGWDTSGSVNKLWEWGTPSDVGPSSAKSGSKCWGTVLDGNYGKDHTLEYLISPPIDITSETQAYLTFYHYFDTDMIPTSGDGGVLEISYASSVSNIGSWWNRLGNIDDYNQYFPGWIGWNHWNYSTDRFWGGQSGGWLKQSFNLSGYIGYYIKLRFVFGSDWQYSAKPGWYIDKIKIEATAPKPPDVPYEDSGISYGNLSSAGVSFGDIDNDGDFDMFENNYYQSYNPVWKNNGGTYVQISSAGKNSSYISILEDFNRDGFLDIMNGNCKGDYPNLSEQANEIFFNNGEGVFSISQNIGNNITRDLAAADYDNDGDVDVFVANIGANDLLVNDGEGNFSESSALLPGSDTTASASGDVDNDGDIDIVVGNYDEISFILLNDGNGNFTKSTNYLGKYNVGSVALGDIDADGDLDIVFGNIGDINSILTNNGSGIFAELTGTHFQIQNLEDITNDTFDIKLADADNDGDLDIFCGNYLSPVRIWLNAGGYIFKDSRNDFGSWATRHIALGDIDKDGDVDLGVANELGANKIYLNSMTNTGSKNRTPTAKVTIKNNTNIPIENIKVSMFVNKYMDFPSESQTISSISPGRSLVIELPAEFNNEILKITEDTPMQAQIQVNYVAEGKRAQLTTTSSFKLYNRYSMTWDNFDKLAAFVTPKDTPIKIFSRGIIQKFRDESIGNLPDSILKAAVIFNAVGATGLTYVLDPQSPYRQKGKTVEIVDQIQYPRDTLRFKTGDCDDCSVLFCALLENIGLNTAFVDVQDHIFMMFDTGVSEDEALMTFGNSDLYIIKDGTAWLPIETTMYNKGFTDAWLSAANTYKEADSKGIATIVDVKNAWETFYPVTLPDTSWEPELPPVSKINEYLTTDKRRFSTLGSKKVIDSLMEQLRMNPKDDEILNKLGATYGKFGDTVNAKKYILEAISINPRNAKYYNNLANVYFLDNKFDLALKNYKESIKLEPENANYRINLANLYSIMGQKSLAEKEMNKAEELLQSQ